MFHVGSQSASLVLPQTISSKAADFQGVVVALMSVHVSICGGVKVYCNVMIKHLCCLCLILEMFPAQNSNVCDG